MNPPERLSALAAVVRNRGPELAQCGVVAGFDGFVDEIISVVQERKGLKDWTPVKDIGAFGDLIKAAAGRSSLREIIVHRADPGGCTVNMGDGLAALGVPMDCFATLGHPRHAAFDDFAGKCRSCHSWGREPGRTLAFEFADGKFMFSAVTQLGEFNTELLEKTLADGAYLRACRQARLIALTDWTLYPHMTSCWRKLLAEVYRQLPHRPWFYFDLVDPTSRAEGDIRDMLETLPEFEKCGPVVLGLNGNEANVVSKVFGKSAVPEEMAAVEEQAAAIRSELGVSQVAIHCVRLAASATAAGVVGAEGPYCQRPKKSTGAGDRFNAGYCGGLMLGFDTMDCVNMGSACSGYFVRQARSASTAELAQFIEEWGRGVVDS